MTNLDIFKIIAVFLFLVYLFYRVIRNEFSNDFVEQLNRDYGGDWYYDDIEKIYRDCMTDRTYRRKEGD